MKPWEDVTFYVLVLPICLAGAWALTGIVLEHRPAWRRCTRTLIGTLALADVTFLVLLATVIGRTHGCPFNGCD